MTSVNKETAGHYRTLMRRFPRPIAPDNDTAPKNARSIRCPGHKDSERAGPGAHRKEPAGPGVVHEGVFGVGPGWRSGPQPRPAAVRRAAALSVFSQVKPDSSRPKWP